MIGEVYDWFDGGYIFPMLLVIAAKIDDLGEFFIIVIGMGQLHLFYFKDSSSIKVKRIMCNELIGLCGALKLFYCQIIKLVIMEELIMQEPDGFGLGSPSKANDYGQSWEDINRGMRKALLMTDQHNQMQGKNTDKIDGTISYNFQKQAPVLSKKPSKETLRVNTNECSDKKERLKIIRIINQEQNNESYRHKLANTNRPEESFGIRHINQEYEHPTRANIVKLNIGETCKDLDKKEGKQYLKDIVVGTKRRRKSEKENHQDQIKKNIGLNIIKQQSFERQKRCQSQVEPNSIQNQRNHNQVFDKIVLTQSSHITTGCFAVQQNPSNLRRRGRQKLPVINMDELQRQRKCSLSIHATSSHHKMVKIHRSLQKNQGQYIRKKENQLIVRYKQQKQRSQVKKNLKILFNPRLSKLKLVI